MILTNVWKEKAKRRREENEALKKRLEELKESRNVWWRKFHEYREKLKEEKKITKRLEKELNESKKKLK